MSRYYEMDVEIKGFNHAKISDIQVAASAEWEFPEDSWDADGPLGNVAETMRVTGRSNLCGGEDEAEFAERLARAIVKANGGPCAIIVRATFLEDLPCEEYSFDEDDYDRLLGEVHDA